MKCVYGAIIRPDEEDGGFWAEIPDLPGCYGQGNTFIEAVESISDGLETHLAAMVEDGMDVPPPTEVACDDGQVVYVYADSDSVDLSRPSVSASEASEVLGVSISRISQLVSAGKLDGRRTPIGMMITKESIKAYSESPRSAGRPRKESAIA